MDAEEDISEDLICPICLHLPENVIFQCSNGHSICAECCQNTETCPQCRVSYDEGKIRNRTMESFIGSMKCICPYKSMGCTQVLTRRDLASHKKACIYNGNCIQLCKLLGFNCDYWTNALTINENANHFLEIHDFHLHKEQNASIKLGNFIGTTLPSVNQDQIENVMWTPILAECTFMTTNVKVKDQDSDTDSDSSSLLGSESSETEEVQITKRFLILSRFHGEDKSMSLACILLDGSVDETLPFDVQFKIKSCSEKVPDLMWKIPPTCYLQSELITLPMSPFRVSTQVLRKYFVQQNEMDESPLFTFKIVHKSDYQTLLGGDDTDDENENSTEPIWLFKIPLHQENPEKCCNECLATDTQILFQCRTCTFSYYLCGQCIEICSHSINHSFDVISGLENPGVMGTPSLLEQNKNEDEVLSILDEELENLIFDDIF